MELLRLSLGSACTLSASINLLALIALALLVTATSWIIKKCIKKVSEKNIEIDEIKLGIGNSSITVNYNQKDREIAYKLWVELNTRKIGLEFDSENDVITEVYDSWYACFHVTRELLKEIPVNRINSSSQLIKLITDILNEGLRPHLTKWQAGFRRWYALEKEKHPDISPQMLQRHYLDYNKLVEDLKQTNRHMIEYKDLLWKIAFDTTPKRIPQFINKTSNRKISKSLKASKE